MDLIASICATPEDRPMTLLSTLLDSTPISTNSSA